MILDACCGELGMYKGMHRNLGDNFIYMDIRVCDLNTFWGGKYQRTRRVTIRPLVKADIGHLPFKDSVFDAIVCDPPHMEAGLKSFMGERFGSWGVKDTIVHMRAANNEFSRVLKHNGMLLLKIFEARFGLYEELLKNFTFFLPIVFKSKSNLSSDKVGWYVAILRQTVQTEPSAGDSGSQELQDQQLPATQPRLEPSAP